jgi:hypothetical protein
MNRCLRNWMTLVAPGKPRSRRRGQRRQARGFPTSRYGRASRLAPLLDRPAARPPAAEKENPVRGWSGRLTVSAGSNDRSAEVDPEQAWLLHQARAYDPAVGRWIETEPIGFDPGDGDWFPFPRQR